MRKFFDWENKIPKKQEQRVQANIDVVKKNIDECFNKVERLSAFVNLSKLKEWEAVKNGVKEEADKLKNAIIYQMMESEEEIAMKMLVRCLDYFVALIDDSENRLKIALSELDTLDDKKKSMDNYIKMQEIRKGGK